MAGIFGGNQPYIPGLTDFRVAEADAQRRGEHSQQQAIGILRMQEAMAQQQENAQTAPLRRRLLEAQVGSAENPSPVFKDLGGAIGIFNPRTMQQIGEIPKSATPDAALRERGADRRHDTASGNAILQERGAMQRHAAPSGSAILSERGQMARHATPSGSAQLSAETARRGQDIDINPAIQAGIAEARAGGKERGEAQAQAAINLPTATAKAEQAINLIDQMLGTTGKKLGAGEKSMPAHPGFESYVGATYAPGARFVEGSDTASFQAMQNQLLGGAFLQAFESLKGGGQITQIEGEKATNAITRMNKAQSEAEYVRAAREFQDVIRSGVERAKQKAGGPQRRRDDPSNDPLGIFK